LLLLVFFLQMSEVRFSGGIMHDGMDGRDGSYERQGWRS
jgi:hypothetical protein